MNIVYGVCLFGFCLVVLRSLWVICCIVGCETGGTCAVGWCRFGVCGFFCRDGGVDCAVDVQDGELLDDYY